MTVQPKEGDRVRAVMPIHERAHQVTRWYGYGEVLQANPRKRQAIVRWSDKTSDLVPFDRLTVLPADPAKAQA